MKTSRIRESGYPITAGGACNDFGFGILLSDNRDDVLDESGKVFNGDASPRRIGIRLVPDFIVSDERLEMPHHEAHVIGVAVNIIVRFELCAIQSVLPDPTLRQSTRVTPFSTMSRTKASRSGGMLYSPRTGLHLLPIKRAVPKIRSATILAPVDRFPLRSPMIAPVVASDAIVR